MKKRAFTLTELLVVVVIIGVLSAVVLPKFTKILQTRKTTEAENVMGAVRNEQEARCMVGRNYVGQNEIGKLASLPNATSKNYTYTLGAQGITATAKDGNYTLQIPSYADGRICCSGEGCEKLNKDYPTCNESFLAAIDQSACQAPIPEAVCVAGETESVACECGQKSRTCNEDGTWGDWSECPACPICTPGEKKGTTCACGVEKGQRCNASGMGWESYDNGTCALTQTEKDTCSCEPKPNTETRSCESGTGTQTREYTCQAGHWVAGEWTGNCEETACEVPAKTTETKYCCTGSRRGPNGEILQAKRTFDTAKCAWGEWSDCTGKFACGCDNKGTQQVWYDPDTCEQTTPPASCSVGACGCEVPAETTQTQATSGCPSRKQTRTFDVDKCEWGEWKCLGNSNSSGKWTPTGYQCQSYLVNCPDTDCYARTGGTGDCPKCVAGSCTDNNGAMANGCASALGGTSVPASGYSCYAAGSIGYMEYRQATSVICVQLKCQ